MTDAQKNALYISQRCREAGLTQAGIAGALVNFECESVISPTNVEDRYHKDTGKSDADYTRRVDTDPGYDFANDNGAHYGYGLAQWTYPSRKVQMRQFHRQRGVSIGDLKTQVEFFLEECRTEYPQVWSTLTVSNDPYLCAYKFCKLYENPANAEAQAVYRAGKAQGWYDWLDEHEGDQADPEKDDEGIPTPTTWPPRTIDRRCAGWPETWMMQSALKCRGYHVLVDGQWPDSLSETLKKFQKSAGLDDDACCGPLTWAALLNLEAH